MAEGCQEDAQCQEGRCVDGECVPDSPDCAQDADCHAGQACVAGQCRAAAGQRLSQAVVIETEVEFVEVYCGQLLFCDIQTFLRSQGFVLHKLVDISGRNFRPVSTGDPTDAMSQFLWAGGVFVRDFAKLDLYTVPQFLMVATVLHDVYFSHDFAHVFLCAHEFPTGSIYAEAYRDRLSQFNAALRQFANIRTHL